METISVDMGVFIRTVTAQLDDGLEEKNGCLVVSVNDEIVLFRRDWLDNLLRTINKVFFKCYGGWRLGLEVHQNGFYTGRVSFVPTL